MNKISNLKVGSSVLFGAITNGNTIVDLAWRKVTANNGFCTASNIAYCEFDAREPGSSNRDRRGRGGNFFPESNIFQYLNARGTNWYKLAHEKDYPPSYETRPGFLTKFTEWELNAIIPHEVIVVVPDGYKRKNGEVMTLTCRVSIPSSSQLCGANLDSEGEQFAFFRNIYPDNGIMTRSASNSGIYITGYKGTLSSHAPADSAVLIPYIQLNGDCVVSDAADDNGNLFVLPPQEVCDSINNDLAQLLAE